VKKLPKLPYGSFFKQKKCCHEETLHVLWSPMFFPQGDPVMLLLQQLHPDGCRLIRKPQTIWRQSLENVTPQMTILKSSSKILPGVLISKQDAIF